MTREISHFIDGQAKGSSLGRMFDAVSPATGELYARVAVGIEADVGHTVRAARAALAGGPWPAMAVRERAAILHRIADEAGSRADEIADAEALSTGLPVTQGRAQAARAAEHFRLAARALIAAGSGSAPEQPFELPRPIGVAGVITSWRTPFLAQARAVAPALAAGCAVVLKPDELAPLSADLLAQVVTGAGLPDGVLNIVHGIWPPTNTEARDRLAGHPDVPAVALSVDAAASARITRQAGPLGKRLSADIAGNALCVIFADAEVGQAVDGALFGAFALNGGRRTAITRVFAERQAYEEVVTRLAEGAGRLCVGPPADPLTRIGPLARADFYDEAVSGIRRGIRDGARLAAGGRRPAGLAEGNYLSATVLADVTPGTQVVAGPVVTVTPFGTEEEASAMARSAGNVRVAYLWTADPARARRLALALDSDATWVNAANAADLWIPPGGQAGHEDIGFYTRVHTVHAGAVDGPLPW